LDGVGAPLASPGTWTSVSYARGGRRARRPSQGSPASRSTSPIVVAVDWFTAPSAPFPRPRGLPTFGSPLVPKDLRSLPQAWVPSQGTDTGSCAPPFRALRQPLLRFLAPSAIDGVRVRFSRVCLTRHVPPSGFFAPSAGFSPHSVRTCKQVRCRSWGSQVTIGGFRRARWPTRRFRRADVGSDGAEHPLALRIKRLRAPRQRRATPPTREGDLRRGPPRPFRSSVPPHDRGPAGSGA